MLSKNKRYELAVNNSEKIVNGDQLAKVLPCLKLSKSYKFAFDRAPLIQNGKQLANVLSGLPIYRRNEFAVTQVDKIKNDGELTSVLSKLKESEREGFKELYKSTHKQLEIPMQSKLGFFCRMSKAFHGKDSAPVNGEAFKAR